MGLSGIRTLNYEHARTPIVPERRLKNSTISFRKRHCFHYTNNVVARNVDRSKDRIDILYMLRIPAIASNFYKRTTTTLDKQ